MEIRELRIGNYICDPNEEIKYHKVEEILKGIDKHLISYGFGLIRAGVDLIEPIPLTEELIIKCGFERQEYNDYRHPVLIGTLTLYEGVAELHISDLYSVWANNLHQLQNLFYSLRGEELEVKI